MNRTTKALAGASLALALGVVGQVAYYGQHPAEHAMQASWRFHPKTSQDLRAHAKGIVLARVVEIARGPDIVTAEPKEPGGVDRIPTQRIVVTVETSYKGKAAAGAKLTLFRTGGSTLPAEPAPGARATTNVAQITLDGDPAYVPGQEYLLMLEPGPDGTQRPVSPEGRYLYSPETQSLGPVEHSAVSDEVAAKRLPDLAPELRQG